MQRVPLGQSPVRKGRERRSLPARQAYIHCPSPETSLCQAHGRLRLSCSVCLSIQLSFCQFSGILTEALLGGAELLTLPPGKRRLRVLRIVGVTPLMAIFEKLDAKVLRVWGLHFLSYCL
jgi:hypothetical protein